MQHEAPNESSTMDSSFEKLWKSAPTSSSTASPPSPPSKRSDTDVTSRVTDEFEISMPQEVFADDDHGDDRSHYTKAGSIQAVRTDDNESIELDMESHVTPADLDQPESAPQKLTASQHSGSAKRSSRGIARLEPVPEPDVACYDAINAGLNQAQQCNERPSTPTRPAPFNFTYETTTRSKKPVPPFVFVHEDGQAKVSMTPTGHALRPSPNQQQQNVPPPKRRCTFTRLFVAVIVVVLILSAISITLGVLQKQQSSSSSDARVTQDVTSPPVAAITLSPTPTPQQTLSPVLEAPTADTATPVMTLPPDPGISPRDDTEEPTVAPYDTRPPRTRHPTQAPTQQAPTTLSPTRLDISPRDDTEAPTESPIGAAPTRPPRATLRPTISTHEPTVQPTLAPTASFSPTATPTTVPIRILLQEIIFEAAPASYSNLLTQGTSQNRALNWLASEDDVLTLIDGPPEKVVQRWALATVFYATNGQDWYQLAGWLTSSDECDWFFRTDRGNTCNNDGYIEILDLEDNNLSGSIPDEIGLFGSAIRILSFIDNTIAGAIPSAIGRLVSLERLELTRNELDGPIPTEVGELRQLTLFGVGRNQLIGPIPSEIANMVDLTALGLERNRLTGYLPPELGNMSALRYLAVDYNDLRGEAPSSLGQLVNLRNLKLNQNAFTGTIGPQICSLATSRNTLISVDCAEVSCTCCVGCCTGTSCPLDWGDRNLRGKLN